MENNKKYLKRIDNDFLKSKESFLHTDIDEFEDKILLRSEEHEEIFGKKFTEKKNKPWKRKIVKIIYNKRLIRRMYRGENTLLKDEFGLTPLSIYELGLGNDNNNIDIGFSRGNKILFYCNHPKHYVRVAFKLGVLSIILGIISIAVTIL